MGMRGEGKEEKGGRGGLSGNVAEETFCLKSAPGLHTCTELMLRQVTTK